MAGRPGVSPCVRNLWNCGHLLAAALCHGCRGASAEARACPGQAVGKPHTLWIAFATFYEKHGDIANARVIFDKASQVGCCAKAPPDRQTDRQTDPTGQTRPTDVAAAWRA
jgi:hypothetical protein